jgi:hypothetical protein
MGDEDDKTSSESLAQLAERAAIARKKTIEGCDTLLPRDIRLPVAGEDIAYELAGRREIECMAVLLIAFCQMQNRDAWTRMSEGELVEVAAWSRMSPHWVSLLVEDGMVLCFLPDSPGAERQYAVTSYFVEFWAAVYPA